MKEAVDFVEEVCCAVCRPLELFTEPLSLQLDDHGLWLDLVTRCVATPYLTGQLLQYCAIPSHSAPSAVDVRVVIESIKPGMPITGLKQRLIDILKDQALRVRACVCVHMCVYAVFVSSCATSTDCV